jgi:selenocysteine-specific elongation factor
MARVHLLESDELKPGETGLAQFALIEPVAVVKGDHFIIRSPNDTLGGGQILSVKPTRHKRFRQDTIEHLKNIDGGSRIDLIVATLEAKQPLTLKALSIECNVPVMDMTEIVDELISENEVVSAGQGDAGLLMSARFWKELSDKALKLVSDYHSTYPTRPGISKSEAVGKLNLKSYPALVQKILDERILIDDGSVIRAPSFTIKLTKEQEMKIDAFMKTLEQNPFTPTGDIVPEPDILSLLMKQNRVVKVSEGVFFSKDANDEMGARITAYGREKGKITAAEVRDLLGTSRKYAIALLEYLDGKKITRRIGDERVIR